MITQPVHFDYGTLHEISSPTAVIDLYAQHEGWEATDLSSECVIGGISPPKKVHPPLRQKRKYDISLRLDLPRSPTNEKCGVFMVNANLLDGERVKLGSSKRPEILPYASNLVHSMRVIASWPFFILGSRKEVEQLDVDLFINYIEVPDRPLHFVELSISRRCVQVAGAKITIEPHLHRVQWLMKHYFFTSALGGIFIINCVYGVAIVLLVLCFHLLKSHGVWDQRPNRQQEQSSDGTQRIEDNVSTQLHYLDESEEPVSIPETVPQPHDEVHFSDDSLDYAATVSEECFQDSKHYEDSDLFSRRIDRINNNESFASPYGADIRRRQPHNSPNL